MTPPGRLSPAWRLLGAGVPLLWLVGAAAGRWGVARLRTVGWLAETALAPCVVRASTGVPCPWCGATRSLELATHGAWGESFAHHPFGLAYLVGGGALALWLAAAVVSGRQLGVPPAASWLVRRARWWWLAVALVVVWLWQVVSVAGGRGPL